MLSDIPGAGRTRDGRRTWLPTLMVLVALALISCSAAPQPVSGPVMDVTLSDFDIVTSQPSVDEGGVTMRIANTGPATHEFVVVKSDLPPDELPIAADGLSADEEQLEFVDEISEIDLDGEATLTLDLEPGGYILFCNLEGHYLGGMTETLEVTGRG
jgi:uncharacterized cupredoxin-like copper-binding protein